jgi:lipid II isoglutaminyl synthase (glutamine-hydrolysing)
MRAANPHNRPRLVLAVAVSRLAAAASSLFGRGGTSLPGLVGQRIEPRSASLLASQLGDGTVVVAGTNGKTTTTMLVASALRASGKRVLHNRAGSNMIRGIASSLLGASTLTGHMRDAVDLTGLFEVDEAALPRVLEELCPRIVTLTNLFRDQLDRYGELATTADRWRAALTRLPRSATIVLNADDPQVAALADAVASRVVFFGVEAWIGAEDAQTIPSRSADSLYCPRCASPLTFSLIAYSHLGHYRCADCGFHRPKPDVLVDVTQHGIESSELRVSYRGATALCRLSLPGRYNAYNAVAALATAACAGTALPLAAKAISEARSAFGRSETIAVDSHDVRLFLIKNPTGADEVFHVAAAGGKASTLVLLLSDNAADGEDVSWIWDARLELLMPWQGPVICGGTRAEDMALRLKYAGQDDSALVLSGDIGAAIERSLQRAADGSPITVIATYTAMLAARDFLARGGHARQFWQIQ